MKLFSNVTRYICLYCNKEFKTASRHDCKRDPDKKNCFTCRHNKEWYREDTENGYSEGGYYTIPVWQVDCAKERECTAPELSRVGYKLNCPDWEQKEEGQ